MHHCKCGFACLYRIAMLNHLERWSNIPKDQWLDELGSPVEHEEVIKNELAD